MLASIMPGPFGRRGYPIGVGVIVVIIGLSTMTTNISLSLVALVLGLFFAYAELRDANPYRYREFKRGPAGIRF